MLSNEVLNIDDGFKWLQWLGITLMTPDNFLYRMLSRDLGFYSYSIASVLEYKKSSTQGMTREN